MLLEIDNGGSSFGISSGTLYVQSATSFTAAQHLLFWILSVDAIARFSEERLVRSLWLLLHRRL